MITIQPQTKIGVKSFTWLDNLGTIQVITEDRNGNPMQNFK